MMKDLLNRNADRITDSKMKDRRMLLVALLVVAVLVSLVLATPTALAQDGGSVGGVVYWIDQYGNARLMPWAQVTADDGVSQVTTYTTDGRYMLWLPAGRYDITASSPPGFAPDTKSDIVVSDGTSTSLDFQLNQTGEPIPELPPWSQPLVVVSTLAITVLAIRRYKTRSKA